MPKKIAIIISPNYKDYAKKYLADCIDSIRKQDYKGQIKIFITDNETSQRSFEYLAKTAPEAELILNKNNDGFAKGNNDAIKLALQEGFNYIILFNIDTVVANDCVSHLVKVAENHNKIGAVQARLMLWSERDKINSLGNITHFLGFGYCIGYQKSWNDRKIDSSFRGDDNNVNIFYPSGAAVLFKRKVLEKVGLFDEEFWMYNEDQDLGWRIWLAGYKCVLAPDAAVYHKYKFAKSIKQYYWMDRNRIIVMIKNYHWRTLVLIAPVCLILELGLIIFAIKGGWFREKLKVYKYFLAPTKWLYLLRVRKQAQSLRKVKDKDIVKMITGKIWYQEIDDWKLRMVNPVFNLYWRIVKRLIIW
ncbi:MAG: glycosyltransferase family 2 protein [Patescibacteria group bacterium]|nr:glycosyltransferase family 2 protein [Patescibacteria group bacterium]